MARVPKAEWIRPAALTVGASVIVVAPSGPFEPRLVWRAMGWLSERYRVHYDRRIFDRRGYLAGDDDARRKELAWALSMPDVSAIFCARGGYGANRFAHELDWERFREAPRWIVGFSDITALHVEAGAVRVSSLHGPNMTALGRGDAVTRQRMIERLEGAPMQRYTALTPLRQGDGTGFLYGGNLALLHACAAAGRLRIPPDCVLLIEDVGERPYRLDRMLTTLVRGGHLDAINGVVVGELAHCGPGPDGVHAHECITDIIAPLGVPVIADLPVGHGLRNDPMVLGELVRIRATAADASLEPA